MRRGRTVHEYALDSAAVTEGSDPPASAGAPGLAYRCTTGFRSTPTPSTSTSITSPGLNAFVVPGVPE